MQISPGYIYETTENTNVLIIEKTSNNNYKFIPLKKESSKIEISELSLFVAIEGVSECVEHFITKEILKINENKFDEILRELVKYTSKIYLKNKKENYRTNYIPAAGKVVGESELNNMIDASLDMWLTTGRFNHQFENELAKFLDVKFALTVNSGSSANLLALTALTSHKLGEKRLKQNDEVITVAASFPTTVAPIIQNGLIPVFVDVDLQNFNIDVNQIEEAITEKTKAIFIAHTLGNPFNIDKVLDICEKYNLWLIEDNCDSLGSKYKSKFTGTFGHIGTISFYPAHHITMGEGGAVITNDKTLHEIILSLRDWGRDCNCPSGKDNSCGKRFNQQHGKLPFGYDHKYVYSHLGYNLKITDWQAAIGLSQLKKLPNFIERRKQNFKLLKDGLHSLENYFILPETSENSEPSWFGFFITLKENVGFSKNDLVEYLENNNIGTRNLFAGNILRQPVFTDNNIKLRIRNSKLLTSFELKDEDFKLLPNTDYIMNKSFWIGLWQGIGEKEIKYIVEKINEFFKNN